MPNQYQATAAAIRAAYGHRLRNAEYCDLLNLHSVPEVVSYLKETEAYGELLRELEPAYTHRGYLEMLLKRSLFTQCLHFCALEHLQKTPFFRFFIYEYEIRELMKKIQLMPSGNASYISEMDAWLGPYLSYSQDALARAETTDGIIAVVAQTPYAAVLRQHYKKNGNSDYTGLEIALRACYLQRILQEAERAVRGDDLSALRQLIAEQVDLINLINAYRLKRVFHADEDTLHSMMLPIQGRLPKRVCEELYAAPNLTAFIEVLKTTRYGRMLDWELNDTPEAMQLEHAFQMLRQKTARSAMHFSGHAAVSLYAVHVLYQIEVENLITIIEGIRYGKPVSYLQSLLITGD
ncbi:MAG: V-type ATPase subunit [Oscillospiraceae bacterium]|nr:V-type ATPase subunit [Oscillospiraceae bacterium]